MPRLVPALLTALVLLALAWVLLTALLVLTVTFVLVLVCHVSSPLAPAKGTDGAGDRSVLAEN